MKRVSVLLVSALFLTLIIFLPALFLGCGDQEEILSGGNNQESKQIEFVTPLRADSYATVASQFNLKTDEINFQIGEFSGGYTLRSDDLKKELLSAKSTFIENMSNALQFSSENNSPELRQNIQTVINIASQNQMLFSRATVRGSTEALAEMNQRGIAIIIPNEKVVQSSNPMTAPQSSSHETWAPYKGTTYVSRNCISNTFFFDNKAGFNSSSTYESETHLYKQYANYGGSWGSNLPMAYKDTQLLDSAGLDNFTVGCLQASSIQPYKEYFAYMALNPETNIKSELWIKGQIGYRYPSWIYSIWNVFPLATTKPGMYKGTAPMAGGVSWGY